MENHFSRLVRRDGREGAVHLGFKKLDAKAFKSIVLRLTCEKERKPPRKCRRFEKNSLPHILATLPRNPYYFNVVGNPIGDKGLIDALQYLPNSIVDLDLSRTNMTSEGANVLFKYMETNTSITRLMMWGNEAIGDGTVGQLLMMIVRNRTLKDFCIRECGLGFPSIAAALTCLSCNNTLEKFNLGGSEELNIPMLNDIWMEQLKRGLQSNTALEELDLRADADFTYQITPRMAELLTELLKTNYHLKSVGGICRAPMDGWTLMDRIAHTPPRLVEANYYLTLNKYGRKLQFEKDKDLGKIVDAMGRGSADCGVLYFFLRNNPSLCDKKE